MNSRGFMAFLPTITLFSSTTLAGDVPTRLNDSLRSIATDGSRVSAIAIDLASGEVVFEREPDESLVPASNQKLLVMACALDLLGPDFSFRTEFLRHANDLVVLGDGDPGLGDPKLLNSNSLTLGDLFRNLANSLRSKQFSPISGDLVLDESIFDDAYFHPTWTNRDRRRWYGAPVGALNVNDNCVDVTVWPAESTGAPAIWSVRPSVRSIPFDNRVKSSKTGVPIIARRGDDNAFILTGECGKRSELLAAPVVDPGFLFADALRTGLAHEGIEIAGVVRRERIRGDNGRPPQGASIISTWETPLSDVLLRAGRDSQNLFAECLAKRVGFEFARRISTDSAVGTWASADDAVTNYLKRAGVDTSGFRFADGSGLSRDNRTTARQFAAVLKHMFGSPDRAMFINSLAVGGEEGTLRRRMKSIGHRVRAKTGSMRGVKSLSGYILAGEEPRFAFSILVNDFRGPAAPINHAMDAFCETLIAEADKSATPENARWTESIAPSAGAGGS
jgi:D-alanyl-D-alanine carboxypeptidase/D-alanyl-D-alanine-endopeptidase (penicillin-binding protein 4)